MRRILLLLAVVAGMVFMTCGVASAATCEINGGAKYTNDPVVSVHYDAGYGNDVFRISNSSYFGSFDEWYAVDSYRYVNWKLDGWSGKQTVYMEFASDPDSVFTSTCQDSIILDQDAPGIFTMPVTVKRGHVCYLPVQMSDVTSPKCLDTVRITTKSGVVKKKFVDIFQRTGRLWYWRYRCNLPVGTYRIKVTCIDLAGNVADFVQNARLRVN